MLAFMKISTIQSLTERTHHTQLQKAIYYINLVKLLQRLGIIYYCRCGSDWKPPPSPRARVGTQQWYTSTGAAREACCDPYGNEVLAYHNVDASWSSLENITAKGVPRASGPVLLRVSQLQLFCSSCDWLKLYLKMFTKSNLTYIDGRTLKRVWKLVSVYHNYSTVDRSHENSLITRESK